MRVRYGFLFLEMEMETYEVLVGEDAERRYTILVVSRVQCFCEIGGGRRTYTPTNTPKMMIRTQKSIRSRNVMKCRLDGSSRPSIALTRAMGELRFLAAAWADIPFQHDYTMYLN